MKHIVDFHTHIFPDKLAAKSLEILGARARLVPFTDGTLNGLLESMKDGGVTESVVLPVVTDPGQFENIFRFMVSVADTEGIVAFGGLHPKSDNYREELRRIKDAGFKGIKLHPDYQQVFIDDPECLRVIDYATELGLWITVHGGIDIGYVDYLGCTPKRVKNVLDQIDTDRLILAHMGAWGLWHEIQELLIGREFYMDTAFCLGRMSEGKIIEMIRQHGAEKILFATDSPWCGQKEDLAVFNSLGLTETEKEMILGGNAARMLGLE